MGVSDLISTTASSFSPIVSPIPPDKSLRFTDKFPPLSKNNKFEYFVSPVTFVNCTDFETCAIGELYPNVLSLVSLTFIVPAVCFDKTPGHWSPLVTISDSFTSTLKVIINIFCK